ncbi:MAG: hypothetical protein ACD_3C00084G0015 [uncultured bacterium (gcode 4)]|uniref:Uncharacterized protein n=1 Tax=uncultured bacterium (gcode 4) TaxID=1234023 RepID=K2GDE3_9BACT|nr:MAG: hypothetical protein ACD_3C00084G0015 [uncultured bacterium (gcode 4)]
MYNTRALNIEYKPEGILGFIFLSEIPLFYIFNFWSIN